MSESVSDNGTLLIRSRRMVLPDGERDASAFVRDGKIEEIGPYDLSRDADRTIDLGDLPLLPGLVDSHVHVNEPGRTEWEGFATATRAALAGGVTTICDMPLNSSPVTTSVEALRLKTEAARGQCSVDVAFWGGAGQRQGHAAAPRRGRDRVQVLPARLRDRRVPAAVA